MSSGVEGSFSSHDGFSSGFFILEHAIQAEPGLGGTRTGTGTYRQESPKKSKIQNMKNRRMGGDHWSRKSPGTAGKLLTPVRVPRWRAEKQIAYDSQAVHDDMNRKHERKVAIA